MKKKIEEIEQARQLRLTGLSIGVIAKQIGVSKSSVSGWVRDIELTIEQENSLYRNGKKKNLELGSKFYQNKKRQERQEYQLSGKEKAKENSWLHMMGCMLYWCEGSKKRNGIIFSNSDLNMIKIFVDFLIVELNVDTKDITVTCQIHLDDVVRQKEIESYWLNELRLTSDNLRKTSVKKINPINGRKNKLVYGLCKIGVYKTHLIQHIYGAIQEYGNFENSKWIE